jgi:Mn-dependent transcriptional regulator
MKIQESAENYLETILVLSQKLEFVRSIDVVNDLQVSKPSVSVAMKNLRTNGYIVINNEGHITLTKSGLKIATDIYERHRLFTDWLIDLGVNPIIAQNDACKMEHAISQESFEAIKAHVNKVEK